MFINNSQPYAQEISINAIVKEKVNSFITLNEAIHIVSYLYSKHDAGAIIERLG